ncbi:D-alanyl-D-alanine carboxypeptidase (penicillin-binding protein 5/6) [Leucobacter komagatae]|uniref:D-alanyl-D-alanine carboxypeptidase (Penicillin-binding protein 5/6) n=1 Tax=Leucobacter komagatae TaxID=55969 RepID=A0A542Y741_9MICO|nr:D-alanyl-D-alanine carboxypeptidase [Leucobacter komagatae]TQL43913.1 D-alanyl-D-alanine carboxypeptidase (penicillin-binding protein 5/6) [Leucobacter komagatae]
MHTEHPPRAHRGRRVAGITTAIIVALGAGYVAACAAIPLPAPTLQLEVPATQVIAVDDAPLQEAVDGYDEPSAVGWLDGGTVWSNDEAAHPLASITKLVTVLVGQEAEPLEPGEDGPSYTWTEADTDLQAALEEIDGIVFPIPEGTKVTRKQMLTLALVPSANDFATAYAHSIFGDNDAFVAAAADWAERNGLESLVVNEPSGMDDGNVASAADIVRLAGLALSDPVVSEIVSMQRATLPWGIGEVENTNPLLGSMGGAIGVKTGHTDVAGYNLAAAATGSYADRELTRIAVVLGRETEEERARDARALLNRLADAPERLAVTSAGEYLGTLSSVDGQFVELSADETVDQVLVPGEELTRTIDPSGESITLSGPDGASVVPVYREGSFTDPTLRWRLTHPRELFFR